MEETQPARGVPSGWFSLARRWLPVGRTLDEGAWSRRHRAILVLLWAHVAAIPIYGVIQGYGVAHSIAESLVVAVPGMIATSAVFSRGLRTWAAAFGMLGSSAVLVHLSNGLIEMHFHFFIMVALVSLYQDWVPFLLAIAYVLIHHGVVGALDPSAVYNHPAALANPWTWAAVHALFIIGMSAISIITWRFNETALALRRRAEQENARLYEAERSARAAAESARNRLSLLAEASRVMSSSLDLDITLRNVAHLFVPAFADVCIVDVQEEDGSLRRVASIGGPRLVPGDVERRVREPAVEADLVARAIADGRSILVEEPNNELASLVADIARADDRAPAGPTSGIVVPLQGRGGVLGALSFATTSDSGRRFGPDDASLAEELARRAATSVEHAALFAHQRGVAETLQRSLLPTSLPSIPGLESAVRYVPAGEGDEVGGDWYDVFVVPGSSVAVVMGDVIGRGIPAASLMGQLRNAVRAHALGDTPPGDVVAKLNQLMHGGESHPSLATLAFVLLDPTSGRLRIVNAGHPPPLIRHADGSATFGPEGLAVPLGTVSTARFPETSEVLGPGDTLLLYTDGLVESRDTPLEEGLRRLHEAAATAPRDVEGLCEHVMRECLQDRRVADDAALLAVRLVELGSRVVFRVPSDPSMLGSVRATLRRWLSRVGVSEEELFEILVASGEACTNAIEHAHGPASAEFELEGVVDDGVAITVRDHGRWRPAGRGLGGRGLHVMRELMDDVTIERTESGTEVRLYRALAPNRVPS